MDVAEAFALGTAAGAVVGAVAALVTAGVRRRSRPTGDATPGNAGRTTPGTGGSTTPETAGSTTPETAGGTTPGAVPTAQTGAATTGTRTTPAHRAATVSQTAPASVTGPGAGGDPAPSTAPQPGGASGQPGLGRLSLQVLQVGVLLLDPDDVVVFANPSARHLGLVADTGKVRTVGHSVLRSMVARVRRAGGSRHVELELPRAGAEPLGVRVRVVALPDRHVLIEVEDMTEAYRVARVRRDFVANVSHELKTPVGALQLLSAALLDATDDPQAALRFAERIQHESARLGRLVSELLELSRLQGGEPLPEPEPVALDRIVNEVLDRSRTAASAKHITLRLAGTRGLKLYGHERLLVTALTNLVDNAIAYSPEHTTTTIAADLRGDHIEITVADQGIGIAPKDQARIFERFYRADPARSRATGGTGLGLAIVKHVATNHGGQVTVASELGGGSTFTLRLPVRPAAAYPDSDQGHQAPRPQQ